ncbi:PIN domain-containing protein [candidate division KSB3 bacterium]|nr:PIN domain-containing protein [candidate division KSB3 bacterium]
MKDKYFLDTNIFVYSFDTLNPGKRKIALDIISKALTQSKGIISYQVIQEFMNVALRKFKVPLGSNDCQKYLTVVLEPICEVYSSIDLFHKALEITERWHFSFYDSLIISAALKAECSVLYSEDIQHQQEIFDLQIINPFES